MPCGSNQMPKEGRSGLLASPDQLKLSKQKLLFLIADGMGDWPVVELGGRTPLEAADTPNMDRMSAFGCQGLCRTVPVGMAPGSDVANMSLLGFDPLKCHTGRGPIEAAAHNLEVSDDDLIWRLNLVTLSDNTDQALMLDYSAGHIDTGKARWIIDDLQGSLGNDQFSFHAGVQYRHILIQHKAERAAALLKVRPPHDILDQPIAQDFIELARCPELLELVRRASVRLAVSAQGSKATAVWPWGQGQPLDLPDFYKMTGLRGAVISAVDLVRGLGRSAGMAVLEVPGATGLIDTNYEGKVQAALDFLKQGDFLYLHLEAPDECGHSGDCAAKVRSIELFDQRIVGPLVESLGETAAFLISCDHLTPLALRTHAPDPVPFMFMQNRDCEINQRVFNEKTAASTGFFLESGAALISFCLDRIKN